MSSARTGRELAEVDGVEILLDLDGGDGLTPRQVRGAIMR
jgi:hypothetical protein